MMGLTTRLRDCLYFIRTKVREQGITPSYDEIAQALGYRTRSTVAGLVEGLEARGIVRRRKYRGTNYSRQRGIQLVQSDYDHRPDDEFCPCPACPARRVQYQQIIEGLQRNPELAPSIKLNGITILSNMTRAALLGVSPRPAAPRTRADVPREVGR